MRLHALQCGKQLSKSEGKGHMKHASSDYREAMPWLHRLGDHSTPGSNCQWEVEGEFDMWYEKSHVMAKNHPKWIGRSLLVPLISYRSVFMEKRKRVWERKFQCCSVFDWHLYSSLRRPLVCCQCVADAVYGHCCTHSIWFGDLWW